MKRRKLSPKQQHLNYRSKKEEAKASIVEPKKPEPVSESKIAAEPAAQPEPVKEIEVDVKLSLEPLKIDISQFESYAHDYFLKLPHEMRESCGGEKIEIALQEKMEAGYDRHYLKIMGDSGNGKVEFGLACVNID